MFLSKLVLRKLEKSTGVELSCFAEIGNIRIAHGKNIVIGGNSKVGDNVTIYNGVTLGVSGRLRIEDNGSVMQINDYPTIEDNCIIYTGAKILGGITIGKNSIIGANSVVIKDVPENSLVVGIPGQIKSLMKFDLSKY